MKYLTASAAVLGLALTALPVHAQSVNANNLVSVSLTNVLNDLARDLSVDVSQIPVTVQAPIGVAANVCPELDANVIAEQNKSGSDEQIECSAESTSQALNEIVQREMKG